MTDEIIDLSTNRTVEVFYNTGHGTSEIRQRLAHQLTGGAFRIIANALPTPMPVVGQWEWLNGEFLTTDLRQLAAPAIMVAAVPKAALIAAQDFAPDEIDVEITAQVEGSKGDVICVRLRFYSAGDDTYTDLTEYCDVLRKAGGITQVTMSLHTTVAALIGDRLEVWARNETSTNPVTLTSGTIVHVQGL